MGRASILVVEDEGIVALDIKARLLELGYSVCGIAATGQDAFDLARERRPDLVLSDIQLRGAMDGIETARLIREQLNLPVVYLTANGDEATLQRAKVTEPYGFLLKPFDERQLEIVIEIGLYRHIVLQRLKEHAKWLTRTLGQVGDAVLTTDTSGRVNYLNKTAQELSGWDPDSALGRELNDIFQTVDRRHGDGLQAGVLRGPGHETPVEGVVSALHEDDGTPVGEILTFRPRPQLRDAEQTIKLLERLAESPESGPEVLSLVASYSDMLLTFLNWNVDLEGRLTRVCQVAVAGTQA